MKRIKVAQIGCGCQHSGQVMQCMLHFPEIFDVVGVADIDGYGSDHDFDGVPRMTEDEIYAVKGLDAIIVEPEEHFLTDTAKRCIERGFPIHMDKPAGENYEDFHALLSLAKAKDLPVHMGYMYRYNPAVRFCLEKVRAGELGKIIAIDTAMSVDHPDHMKKWLGTFKAGTMYILGCHMVDLIMTIMGGMPEKIYSFQKKTMIHGIDLYDNDFALLEYPGATCTVRINSSEANGFGRRQLVVVGEKGSIDIMPMESPLRASISMKDAGVNPFSEYRTPLNFTVGGRYDDMMKEFAAIVRGEIANPYTYEHELALHKAHLVACGLQDLALDEEITL